MAFSNNVLNVIMSVKKLKPLYKELLYTIAHKMGKPSSNEIFTDDQLRQYIREVKTYTRG